MKILTNLLLNCIGILLLMDVFYLLLPKTIKIGLKSTTKLFLLVSQLGFNLMVNTINLVIKQVGTCVKTQKKPEVSNTYKTPKTQNISKKPKIQDITSKTPKTQDISNISKKPKIQKTPKIQDTPNISKKPKTQKTPKTHDNVINLEKKAK